MSASTSLFRVGPNPRADGREKCVQQSFAALLIALLVSLTAHHTFQGAVHFVSDPAVQRPGHTAAGLRSGLPAVPITSPWRSVLAGPIQPEAPTTFRWHSTSRPPPRLPGLTPSMRDTSSAVGPLLALSLLAAAALTAGWAAARRAWPPRHQQPGLTVAMASVQAASDAQGPKKAAAAGVQQLTVEVGTARLVFETGKMGRQAAGAVLLKDGATHIYGTVCHEEAEVVDESTPLKVDYVERFSAAGATSTSLVRRDGRPREQEILVARLVDRAVRPLLTSYLETQVQLWVLSYDGQRDTDPLAICCAGAAVALSDVPTREVVAGVKVAEVNGTLVINPSREELGRATFELVVAGTMQAVVMLEGSAAFVPEDRLAEAIEVGAGAVAHICRELTAWAHRLGRAPPRCGPAHRDVLRLAKDLLAEFADDIDRTHLSPEKPDRQARLRALQSTVAARFPALDAKWVEAALRKACSVGYHRRLQAGGLRADGRRPTDIRPIAIETSLLPCTHGSALFTRGATQALATVTLGDRTMQLTSQSLDGAHRRDFYLQYTFPACAIGEVSRGGGGPSRRELGHGDLAERALLPAIPAEEEYGLVIRAESLITESSGSSSMASVCGGCLALLDAGVPIKRHVAGVAVGLSADPEQPVSLDNACLLTDISELEDQLGAMDLKVAGDDAGVSAVQLDVKCAGLPLPLLRAALRRARDGRLHILNRMRAAMPGVNLQLPDHVPKVRTMPLPPGMQGAIIGPGGANIKEAMKASGATLAVAGNNVRITAMAPAALDKAAALIHEMVAKASSKNTQLERLSKLPFIETLLLPAEKQGLSSLRIRISGKNGRNLKEIQTTTGVEYLDVSNKGDVTIYAATAEALGKAKGMVQQLFARAGTPEEAKPLTLGVVQTLEVPPAAVSFLIGPSGKAVKEMVAGAGVYEIQIFPNGNITIRGPTQEAVDRARELLSQRMLAAASLAEAPGEEHLEETFHIPRPLLGRVIGSGGSNVKRIKERTGATHLAVNSEEATVRAVAPTREVLASVKAELEAAIGGALAAAPPSPAPEEPALLRTTFTLPPALAAAAQALPSAELQRIVAESGARDVQVFGTGQVTIYCATATQLAKAKTAFDELLVAQVPQGKDAVVEGTAAAKVPVGQPPSEVQPPSKADGPGGREAPVRAADELAMSGGALDVQELPLPVPREVRAAVVGHGGAGLRDLARRSGAADITVDDDGVVTVRAASPEVVQRASELIVERVLQEILTLQEQGLDPAVVGDGVA